MAVYINQINKRRAAEQAAMAEEVVSVEGVPPVEPVIDNPETPEAV